MSFYHGKSAFVITEMVQIMTGYTPFYRRNSIFESAAKAEMKNNRKSGQYRFLLCLNNFSLCSPLAYPGTNEFQIC